MKWFKIVFNNELLDCIFPESSIDSICQHKDHIFIGTLDNSGYTFKPEQGDKIYWVKERANEIDRN